MVLHAFLIAGMTLSVCAVFAVAMAVLIIADREGKPYLVAGRFLLNPIAIRYLRRTQPDLVAGYAEHGHTRWSEIAELRERGWTPQAITDVPFFVQRRDSQENVTSRTVIVQEITGPAWAAFMPRKGRAPGEWLPLPVVPMALHDMQAWYDLLGPDAAAGPSSGLTLSEARTMAAEGALDGPTVRAMAALRAPADGLISA